jgi:outer membrane biosynthesis protein TonB
MNPEQEIELVLRVLSTRPTDEEIFHLEHEDVNPRKVEQKPEEEPEEEPEEKPEEKPEEEPEDEPEEEPEEEPVPLPVPVGGTLSSWTARSVHSKSSELMKQRVGLPTSRHSGLGAVALNRRSSAFWRQQGSAGMPS